MNIDQINIFEDLSLIIVDIGTDLDTVWEKGKAKVLTDLINHNKDIILNLESCEYIDSSGIGLLLKMHRTLKKQNRTFFLYNINSKIKRIFQLISLDTYFDIIDTKKVTPPDLDCD